MHFVSKPLVVVCLLILFLLPLQTTAKSILFQNSSNLSEQNIQLFLDRFVQQPHPMGSVAQKKLAQDLEKSLSKFGLISSLQHFKTLVPNIVNSQNNEAKNLISVDGYNIVARRPGERNCSIIFGGHYDTKYFSTFNFLGANDGGSSTALLLELARVVKKTQFSPNSLGACSLDFVFFDGEEAYFQDWDEGERRFKIQDNLYGSRAFVKKYLKKHNGKAEFNQQPLSLVFVVDMVGHKNQKLFITEGSDKLFSEKLMKSNHTIDIHNAGIYIDDDHAPFFEFGVPILHVIDWTNLNEWHTVNDNLSIISSQKLTQFGELILQFLHST